MHFMIGSQMGLVALPFIVGVGLAYMWVVGRLLSRTSGSHVVERDTKAVIPVKSAKAA